MGYKNTSTDDNQSGIVRDLRKAGATVHSLHAVGQGVPDLLVGFRGKNYLLEVKAATGSLRPSQVSWHDIWAGQCCVVRDSLQALLVIGAITKEHTA